jgi:hypothetical protein
VPGLAELAYTTLGGIVGATASGYFTRHHERRQLRAAVMDRVQAMTAITAGVRDVELGWAPMPRTVGGKPSLTSELGIKATLDGGADAEQAQREAFAGLIVAALAAGVPRRVTDFAAGAHERALECNVIALIDHRVGGVLGASAAELVQRADEYQRAAVGLLLHALWRPWQAKLSTRARIHDLRTEVEALHELQHATRTRVSQPEYTERLFGHLDPDGKRWQTWRITPESASDHAS